MPGLDFWSKQVVTMGASATTASPSRACPLATKEPSCWQVKEVLSPVLPGPWKLTSAGLTPAPSEPFNASLMDSSPW